MRRGQAAQVSTVDLCLALPLAHQPRHLSFAAFNDKSNRMYRFVPHKNIFETYARIQSKSERVFAIVCEEMPVVPIPIHFTGDSPHNVVNARCLTCNCVCALSS